MDEAVIKYYRNLLRKGFKFSGSIENPSIFLDNVGEKVLICGSTGDYMQLYVHVVNNIIDDIKYMCVCDPTANVAVEILCTLMKGKTTQEAAEVREEAFYQFLGCHGEDLQKKVKGLLELLKRGITRYRIQNTMGKRTINGDEKLSKTN
jgi:NifU-like protein involved in Fe-S cluster formation